MEGSVAATPPAQGAPTTPAQPPASGQGGGQGQPTGGQGGFNWGLFPSVPESQRELLEPHLRNVQGHVTQLEQRMAPYKDFMGSVDPGDVGQLMQFLQSYNQDPMSTIMGLVANQHEQGAIKNPEFSLEALQSMLQGGGGAPAQGSAPTDDMPAWAQEMRQQLGMLSQGEEQRQQQAQLQQQQTQQAENDRILSEGHTEIRSQLKAAGVPEVKQDGNTPFFSNEQLTASLITHQGDITAVVQDLISMRDGFLGGFVQQNGGQRGPAPMNGGAPEAPSEGKLRPKRGDGFRAASIGAEQTLRQRQQAQAQS